MRCLLNGVMLEDLKAQKYVMIDAEGQMCCFGWNFVLCGPCYEGSSQASGFEQEMARGDIATVKGV